jgi:uncharacterized protein (DUF58 family)
MADPPTGNATSAPPRPPAEPDASLYLHPQTLARLGSFELRAKMIVEGVMSGQHRSPYQGFSVEFAQHRPYVSGDDIRHLDWKVYARTDKLHLKQYQQETNLDLLLMVDSSGSMNFGTRLFEEASGAGRKTSPTGRSNWTKFDHATAVAAALAYITLHQGDRVGLVVYADQVRTMFKRSSSPGTWRQIVSKMLAKVTNRCLVAIISDFFEDPEQIRTAIARLRHKGHDAIAFQVLDRAETEFNITEAAPFEGLEGEPRLRIDPRAIRASYLEAIHTHIGRVEKIIRGFGFDHQQVDTHDWLGPPLAAFVARRNAQIKKSKYG